MTCFQESIHPILPIALLYLNITVIPYGSNKPVEPLSNTK